jgi:hypothetical protein
VIILKLHILAILSLLSLFLLAGIANALPPGQWAQTTSYPSLFGSPTWSSGNQNGCVVWNNYIYCVGGDAVNPNNGITNVTTAPLSASGIGTWAETTQYPYKQEALACVPLQGYIYCIGGDDSIGGDFNSVYAAKVVSNGNLGAWVMTSNYPYPVDSQSCFPDNATNRIYCLGGINAHGLNIAFNAIYYASATAGSVGTWTMATNSYPLNLTDPVCAMTSNIIRCLGGATYSGTFVSNSYYASVLSNGDIGQWQTTNPYPYPIISLGCPIVAGFIYCPGGIAPPFVYVANSYVAQLTDTGLSAWQPFAAYPINATSNCVSNKGYIYCTGAAFTTDTTNNGLKSFYYNATPSPIIHQIPITLYNFQTNAVPINATVAVGAITNSTVNQIITGIPNSIINQYCDANCDNVKFTFSNGTTIYSWLEGNPANEMTPVNQLLSQNDMLWQLNLGKNAPNLLPAALHNHETNYTIEMDFAGNVATPYNTLLNGNTTGEAPQLSPIYGEYDNGNKVFTTLYQNFIGNTIPNGWTTSTSGPKINNGVTINYGASGENIYTNTIYGLNQSQILDFYANLSAASSFYNEGFGYNNGQSNICSSGSDSAWWELNTGLSANPSPLNCVLPTGSYTFINVAPAPPNYNVYAVYFWNTTSDTFYRNYSTIYHVNGPPSVQLPVGGSSTQGTQQSINITWVRIRNIQAHAQSPATTGAVMNITPSLIQNGNPVEITANVLGSQFLAGNPSPYTYNYFVYNPSGALAFTASYQTALLSNSFTFTQNMPSGLWTANVVITSNTGIKFTLSQQYNNYVQQKCLNTQLGYVVINSTQLYHNTCGGIYIYAKTNQSLFAWLGNTTFPVANIIAINSIVTNSPYISPKQILPLNGTIYQNTKGQPIRIDFYIDGNASIFAYSGNASSDIQPSAAENLNITKFLFTGKMAAINNGIATPVQTAGDVLVPAGGYYRFYYTGNMNVSALTAFPVNFIYFDEAVIPNTTSIAEQTTTLYVPAGYWFKYNFSGSANFTVESQTASNKILALPLSNGSAQSGESMILIILILFAALFLGLRLIRIREISFWNIVLETLAGIMFAFAWFFTLSPIPTTSATLTTISNQSGTVYNVVSNTITTNAPNWYSVQPIVISFIFAILIVFIAVLTLSDIPPVFFPLKYPKTPSLK